MPPPCRRSTRRRRHQRCRRRCHGAQWDHLRKLSKNNLLTFLSAVDNGPLLEEPCSDWKNYPASQICRANVQFWINVQF